MEKFELSRTVSRNLLKIEAIKFNFAEPYTWASGWKSPVYCDNRLSLSDVAVRSLISDAYVKIIQTEFPDAEIIAGVATGAIAQGALVAHELGLPFVYVREKPKGHGLMKVIEGGAVAGQKTVIIEDLVSTGGSSLKAARELRNAEAIVLGMAAIFTYEFPIAAENFMQNDCKLHTISTFSTLIEVALEDGYINKTEADKLIRWYKEPQMYK